jgi:anti-anti-sigma factor
MLGDLELTSEDGVVIAELRGEIDMSNAGELAGAITRATPNDAFGVALDLSEVEYLDSAGIHLLYRLRESLRSRGQTLQLVIPQESAVITALRLAGIERQIDTFDTLDEAVEHLRPAQATGSET